MTLHMCLKFVTQRADPNVCKLTHCVGGWDISGRKAEEGDKAIYMCCECMKQPKWGRWGKTWLSQVSLEMDATHKAEG